MGLGSMKKNDFKLIAVIAALALAAFAGISLYSVRTTREGEAVVYFDGDEQGRYPLNQDISVEIPSEDGNYNRQIGRASCRERVSSCV